MSNPEDLVVFDNDGNVADVGPAARQIFKRLPGAFRALPTPTHALLLRYTGEDGRRDENDGAPILLAGEITAPGFLTNVMAMIGHARWCGTLIVSTRTSSRSIYIDGGDVIGATTSLPDERLGEIMFRRGILNMPQLKQTVAALGGGKRFGEALIELGHATQEQIYTSIGVQIEEVVLGAVLEDDGTYFFLEGIDEDNLPTGHAINCNGLIMDLTTRLDEIRYFRQEIPDGMWVAECTSMPPPAVSELAPVYEAVNGRRSVVDIGRVTGLGEFQATRALARLKQSGHVNVNAPVTLDAPQEIVAVANRVLSVINKFVVDPGMRLELASSLDDFSADAPLYAALLRGAGPMPDGTLDAARIAQNIQGISPPPDAHTIRRKLLAYVSFGLFIAGSLLGTASEMQLNRLCRADLRLLRPASLQVSSRPPPSSRR